VSSHSTAGLSVALRGNCPGPLFWWEDGVSLAKPKFVSKVRAALSAANLPAHQFAGNTVLEGGQQQQQQWQAYRILQSRHWADERVQHIYSTSS